MKREEIQNIINPKYIDDAKIEELRHNFANAPHCKHIILDDFFTEETANLLFEHFPPFESLNVIRKSLNENKREDYNFEEWNPIFQKVRETLASEEWSKILSEITGIDGLFTNFDSLGQGVHQGAQGSYLDVHIDVNVNVEWTTSAILDESELPSVDDGIYSATVDVSLANTTAYLG